METFDTFSDEQLLQKIKSGDRKAFEFIYKKYWSRIFEVAFKKLQSKEAVEEIIQDIFIYIWCKREDIQITHTFSTYLFSALKYKIFNHIRNEKTKKKYCESVNHNQPQLKNTVEESVFSEELNLIIEKEINDLPERCRQAFKLSRKENLTFKEIAVKLNISINTVEKHVGKALKILRANLKDYISTISLLFLLLFG